MTDAKWITEGLCARRQELFRQEELFNSLGFELAINES